MGFYLADLFLRLSDLKNIFHLALTYETLISKFYREV